MAGEGRISGRLSEDGKSYELVQGGSVRVTIPVEDVGEKMKAAIERNRWERVDAD